MPRQRNVIPAYLLHRPTGNARVRIDGHDHYLGKYGSDESHRKYGELISRHCAGLPIDPHATPANQFTPLFLKACREKFVDNGWTRTFCNKSTNRLRHIFKWGVSNGMVPVETWQALQSVEPLKAGKTSAPDRKPRRAVPLEIQEAAREKLCSEDQRFFDLLRYSGSRPSEILRLSWTGLTRFGLHRRRIINAYIWGKTARSISGRSVKRR